MTIEKRTLLLCIGATLIFAIVLMGMQAINHSASMNNTTSSKIMYLSESETNKELAEKVEIGIYALIADGRYKCCLETPCTYCFTDREHHDNKLVCDCLTDIMNGKAPCGECIGEILEGEGEKLIAEYFATSIAEEMGYEYLDMIQQIIEEKYNIPMSQQI